MARRRWVPVWGIDSSIKRSGSRAGGDEAVCLDHPSLRPGRRKGRGALATPRNQHVNSHCARPTRRRVGEGEPAATTGDLTATAGCLASSRAAGRSSGSGSSSSSSSSSGQQRAAAVSRSWRRGVHLRARNTSAAVQSQSQCRSASVDPLGGGRTSGAPTWRGRRTATAHGPQPTPTAHSPQPAAHSAVQMAGATAPGVVGAGAAARRSSVPRRVALAGCRRSSSGAEPGQSAPRLAPRP